MNLTANAAPTPATAVSAAAGALSIAGPAAGSAAARPFAGTGALAAGESFSTTAAVDGRSVEIPVSVNHRAGETYARAASIPPAVDPTAVDPTAARGGLVTAASAKSGRGKLAAASQWDR